MPDRSTYGMPQPVLNRLASSLALALTAAIVILAPSPSSAQNVDIVTDTTTGVGITGVFNGSTADIRADIYATREGENVFYSFDRFNIGTEATATLLPSTDPSHIVLPTESVIARVTGSDPSSLDGNLRVAGFGENHFLFLNPNGVIFGPNATVSTSGSLHVSTADEIVFEGGNVVFSAVDPAGSVLSSAPPEAFGFLGTEAGEIRVEGDAESFPLAVPEGRILTLAGGDITLDGAQLFAQSGTIRLVATRSAGRLDGILDENGALSTELFEELGSVSLINGSTVSASGLELQSDGSPFLLRDIIQRDIIQGRGCAQGECLLDIATISLASVQPEYIVLAEDQAANEALVLRPLIEGKPGGRVLVRADSLGVSDSDIRSRSFERNPGGIDVQVRETLTLAKRDATSEAETGISARADALAYVNPEVDDLGEPAQISFFFQGGFVTPEPGSFLSNGEGGDITIEANRLVMSGGAKVSTTTFSQGAAGNLTLRLTDRLEITGTDSNDEETPTGLFANAQGDATGQAGTISVSGPIGENAPPDIYLDGGGAIIAQTTANADAGDIFVHGRRIYVGPDSQIDSSTSGQTLTGGSGTGGEVNVTADEQIELEGSVRTGFFGHISTGSKGASNGDAGTVKVTTPHLIIRDGPGISVVTQGSGSSGNIVLDVGRLELDNGSISAESTAAADDLGEGITPGNAGNILIGVLPPDGESDEPRPPQYPNTLVHLENGSEIVTRAAGASGGNILINATIEPVLQDGIPVTDADGRILQDLVKPTDGLARQIELVDSSISTSVTRGAGSGGNIAIDPSALVLNASNVTAQADAGAGGDIFIATDFIIQSTDSLISASAGPAGIDGNIVVQGTSVLVVDQSAEQPAAYLRADALMSKRCAARSPEEGVGRLTVESFRESATSLDGYLFSHSGESASARLRNEMEACVSAS